MIKTKIGLVGFGVIGKKHADALISSQSCDLAAIIDTDTDTKEFAETNNVIY